MDSPEIAQADDAYEALEYLLKMWNSIFTNITWINESEDEEVVSLCFENIQIIFEDTDVNSAIELALSDDEDINLAVKKLISLDIIKEEWVRPARLIRKIRNSVNLEANYIIEVFYPKTNKFYQIESKDTLFADIARIQMEDWLKISEIADTDGKVIYKDITYVKIKT